MDGCQIQHEDPPAEVRGRPLLAFRRVDEPAQEVELGTDASENLCNYQTCAAGSTHRLVGIIRAVFLQVLQTPIDLRPKVLQALLKVRRDLRDNMSSGPVKGIFQ